jgi:deazaflavin-dependent oxidoreductase (nitroreductase family)
VADDPRLPRDTRARRLAVSGVGWLSTRRWFPRVAPHVFPPLDRWVNRVTGGRRFLSELFVPTILLTTTGARSGLPRPSPLACVPVGIDEYLVVGSNYGGERHPAWTTNLLAHPDATVTAEGRVVAVRAAMLGGAERDDAWRQMTAVYPPWAAYASTAPRELRLFRLRPAGEEAGVDTP